jgi:hypothetical protein
MAIQDVTWLVLVKTFWTRITSVFFLGRHYHRICHQLNIYGMNSVDVFATVQINRKHYGSCVTHLCTSGTTSHKPLSNDWLVICVRDAKLSLLQEVVTHVTELRKPFILHDNFCLSMICSDIDVDKFSWYYLIICYAHMNFNYTIFVDFFSLCNKIEHQTLVLFLSLTSM